MKKYIRKCLMLLVLLTTQLTYAQTYDFNVDGHYDLLVHNTNNGRVNAWLNLDDETENKYIKTLNDNLEIIAIADINGDGKSDVIIKNRDNRRVNAWITTAGQSTSQYLKTLSPTVEIVDVADLNGDGKDDIIVENTDNRRVNAWLSTDGESTNKYLKTLSPVVEIIDIADVDGDGKDDIIVKNTDNRRINAWISTNGESTNKYLKTLSLVVEEIGIADIDGDGKDDIIVKNTDNRRINAWISTDGQSTNKYLKTLSPVVEIVDIADIDGDGKDDIIVKNTDNRRVNAWISTAGVSINQFLKTLAPNLEIVTVGDVDGDGRDDIIVLNINNGRVSAWLNTEGGIISRYLKTLENGVILVCDAEEEDALSSKIVGTTQYFAPESGEGIYGHRYYDEDGTYTGEITLVDGTVLVVSGIYSIEDDVITINRISPVNLFLTLTYTGEDFGGITFDINSSGNIFHSVSFTNDESARDAHLSRNLEESIDIKFWTNITEAEFNETIATDISTLFNQSFYELEYERYDGLKVSRRDLNATGFNEFEGEFNVSGHLIAWRSDGSMNFTKTDNVLYFDEDDDGEANFAVKYVGELSSDELNVLDSNDIFGENVVAHKLMFTVLQESLDFDSGYVRSYGNTDNEYYISLAEMIENQQGGNWFMSKDGNQGGISFANGSIGTSGTLVEVNVNGEETVANAGVWEIIEGILYVNPNDDLGYDYAPVFKEVIDENDDTRVQRGEVNEVGASEVFHWFNEVAISDLVTYLQNNNLPIHGEDAGDSSNLNSRIVGTTQYFAAESGEGIYGHRYYDENGTYYGEITLVDGTVLVVSGTYIIEGDIITVNRLEPSTSLLTLSYIGEDFGGLIFDVNVSGNISRSLSFISIEARDDYLNAHIDDETRLRNKLANQTYYMPYVDDNGTKIIRELIFDDNITSVAWQDIGGGNTSAVSSIELDGTNLHIDGELELSIDLHAEEGQPFSAYVSRYNYDDFNSTFPEGSFVFFESEDEVYSYLGSRLAGETMYIPMFEENMIMEVVFNEEMTTIFRTTESSIEVFGDRLYIGENEVMMLRYSYVDQLVFDYEGLDENNESIYRSMMIMYVDAANAQSELDDYNSQPRIILSEDAISMNIGEIRTVTYTTTSIDSIDVEYAPDFVTLYEGNQTIVIDTNELQASEEFIIELSGTNDETGDRVFESLFVEVLNNIED